MEKNTKDNKGYTVESGMYVEYSYELTDAADGNLLFEAARSHPDQMIYGVSQEVIPGLITAMEGLKEGDRFDVELPPAAAFGDRIPDEIMELDRTIFERDGKLADEVKVDAVLPMMTADGFRIMGKVVSIGDKVTMDFNHPFAGLTVRYKGEIVTVRPATEDELHPTSGCGCCGNGGCNSDKGGCNSGSGCCGGC